MENPSAFLERLRECLCIYMTTDSESLEGNAILRSYFISQSVPDLRLKLQKLEIEPDIPTSHLVKVAYWVFNNSDTEEKKSEDKTARRQAHPLAVALQCQPGGTGIWTNCPRRLLTPVSDSEPPPRDSKPRKQGPNQCAICKQEGHWKECPRCPGRGKEMADPSHHPQRQMV